MAPMRAVTDSMSRPSDSLMVMLPLPVEWACTLATTVLSNMPPLVVTFKWSAMKTEAPSMVTEAADTSMSPPAMALAATMPPSTVSVPVTLMLTLLAGSKPCKPPMKPLSVRSLVPMPVALDRPTSMSRSARSSKLVAGSTPERMVMLPVCCMPWSSTTRSDISPSPLKSAPQADSW